jgi:hypothetical protein
MGQNPAALLAFGLALGLDGTWFGTLDKTLDRTTVTGRDAAGNDRGGTVFDADPAAVNRTFDKPFEMKGGFVDVPVGLGSVNVGSATLYPALVGSLGWYDFEFSPRNRQTGTTTTFNGDGLVVGGGLELLAARGPWFAALSLLYRTSLDVSVDRSPLGPPPTGGTIAQSGDLDFEQLTVGLRGGRTFRTGWPYLRSVAPFVGVEASWTNVRLDTRVTGTFPDGSSQTFAFREELERETWRGQVGVDMHIAGPLFGRVTGSFDTCDQAVLLKLVYRLGGGVE